MKIGLATLMVFYMTYLSQFAFAQNKWVFEEYHYNYLENEGAEYWEKAEGTADDFKTVLKLLKKVAKEGDLKALKAIASIYYYEDRKAIKAIKLLNKPALKNDMQAHEIRGTILYETKNFKEGYFAFEQAQNLRSEQAEIMKRNCEDEMTLQDYKSLALEGHVYFMFKYALGLYFNSNDIISEEALKFFEMAARKGHIEAQYYVAIGHFDSKKMDKAKYWFEEFIKNTKKSGDEFYESRVEDATNKLLIITKTDD